MAEPDPEKLEKLKQALADYASGATGEGFFDREAEEEKARVRARALGLLDQRARSRDELRGRLVDAEFVPEVVDDVLDDLVRVGLVDDASFASEWVRQRQQRRGKSARMLDKELRDKGVSQLDRAEALAQISDEDEQLTARSVAEKKARSLKTVPDGRKEYDRQLRRIVGAVARRGFAEGMAFAVGKQVLDDRIDELDYSAGLRISE